MEWGLEWGQIKYVRVWNTGPFGKAGYEIAFNHSEIFGELLNFSATLISLSEVNLGGIVDQYDFGTQPVAGNKAINTAHIFYDVITPGINVTSASGHGYRLNAIPDGPAEVPERQSAALPGLGISLICWFRRRSPRRQAR